MKRVICAFLLLIGSLQTLQAQDYVLNAGDSVLITVHQHPDLDTKARIEEGGTINFPLLGSIQIGNMSTEQAGLLIENSLKRGNFIKSPQVSILIEEYRSKNVSVLGKIEKPGKYPIIGSNSILEIIAEAGGLAKDGSPRVVITRKGQKPFTVDTALALQGDVKNNVEVISGDIIYVPRMDVFYIYGEVNKPGEYQLQDNMTILQALSVAGGLNDKATERGLKIKRKNANGEVETIDAVVTDELIPGDVVYVKESLF